MTDNSSNVELTYEPPFGPAGPSEIEDNVMVEKPIGIYSLSDKTREKVQKMITNSGIDGFVVDAIVIANRTNEGQFNKLTKQINAAISAAMRDLLQQKDYPTNNSR